MPDPLDYRTPSPDEGHEAIRAPLAAAINRLDEQLDRLDNVFLLLLSTTDFAQSTLNTVLAGQDAITGMQSALGGLNARLAALEAAHQPPAEEPVIPPTDPPAEIL